MGKLKYLVHAGEKYNHWTALSKISGGRVEKWICKCDCGTVKIVNKSHLHQGDSKSCGCVRNDKIKNVNLSHNMSRSKEYQSWTAMKNRCNNPNSEDYKYYGGRGIIVDSLWDSSFEKFIESMGKMPNYETRWTVGRLDNNVGYSPLNCRWETDDQQGRNHRKTVLNKSGKTGVHFRGDEYPCYVATWVDLEKKSRTKQFSINKYGENEAWLLACATRDAAIERLNSLGADYSPKHGQ